MIDTCLRRRPASAVLLDPDIVRRVLVGGQGSAVRSRD